MGKALTEWGLVRRPRWVWALVFGFPMAVLNGLVRVEEKGVLAAAVFGTISAATFVLLWTVVLDTLEPEAFRKLSRHQRLAAVRALESGELPAEPDVAQAAVELAAKQVRHPPRIARARVLFAVLYVAAIAVLIKAAVNRDWPEMTAGIIGLVGAIWLFTICPAQQKAAFEQARTFLNARPPDASPAGPPALEGRGSTNRST